jgi:DNA-binding transcriptional ArsR family regulator
MTDSAGQDREGAPSGAGVVVDDPRAIRALAHPARLAILEHLGTGVTATATECARVCGLSPSATSYHLRALARWGLVEDAESSGDGRERRWRAVGGGGFSTRGGFAAPGGVGAAQQFMFRRSEAISDRRTEAYLAAAADESPEWQDAAVTSYSRLLVTAAELEELAARIFALMAPYRLAARSGEEPDGARQVFVNLRMLPLVGEDTD